jgi:hypothetical protein
MSVIFRRVTNGFRSEWGRDLLAAVRSVVNTGKRQGLTAMFNRGQPPGMGGFSAKLLNTDMIAFSLSTAFLFPFKAQIYCLRIHSVAKSKKCKASSSLLGKWL